MKYLPLVASLLCAPAHAVERGYSVTDFDRVRVDGPYKVTLTTGKSPGARAIGTPAAIDAVSVEMQGRTLIVRRATQVWGGTPGRTAGPVELRLTGYGLRGAALNGAGSLTIDRLKGQSIDLAVAGSGSLSVGGVTADRLTLAVTGNGRARVAGTAQVAQLGIRGTGAIEAAELTVKDLRVVADGAGDIAVAATASANIMSNGAGTIVVGGRPACTVKATGSGEVRCGE